MAVGLGFLYKKATGTPQDSASVLLSWIVFAIIGFGTAFAFSARARRTRPSPTTIRTATFGKLRVDSIFAGWTSNQRLEFLNTLKLPDDERAYWIGEIYRRSSGGRTAEFLIDLEADPEARAKVMAILRVAEGAES